MKHVSRWNLSTTNTLIISNINTILLLYINPLQPSSAQLLQKQISQEHTYNIQMLVDLLVHYICLSSPLKWALRRRTLLMYALRLRQHNPVYEKDHNTTMSLFWHPYNLWPVVVLFILVDSCSIYLHILTLSFQLYYHSE